MVSRPRRLSGKVTEAEGNTGRCRAESRGWANRSHGRGLSSRHPPSPPTVLSQRLIVALCVWHDLLIRQRLQWVMRPSSRSETGWGPRWEAASSPSWSSLSLTPTASSKGAGQVLAEGASCSPHPPFFAQAHHACHRTKWVKSTIKSLLGVCYPNALCDRQYF